MSIAKKIFFITFFITHFLLSGSEKSSSICLNMIVRNEAHVIERCLDSVKDLIDFWVIVDTGSTDNTKEVISNFLKDIPGALYERPWLNFEHNRNEALELAKLEADYILFMDADDWIQKEPNFILPDLSKDVYSIWWEHNENFRYLKPFIIKSTLPWTWCGVLHEYLSCPVIREEETLKNIKYVYGGDGARSKDPQKFAKAAEIFENALILEPDNSRYAFYLGESYKDAGEIHKAYAAYEKRTQMSGWDQETFWSFLQMAFLKSQMDTSTEEEIIAHYQNAHAFRPHRIEPIYFLSEIYNRKGDFQQAYTCITTWKEKKQKNTDVLFNFTWIEEYGLDFQLAISMYYLGKEQESLMLWDKILTASTLPSAFKEQAITNRALTLHKLQTLVSTEKTYHNTVLDYVTDSEIYYTLLLDQAKICEVQNSSFEVTEKAYLRAYHYNPLRAEAPYYLATFYRKNKKYEDAYKISLEGKKNVLLNPEIKNWIYDYGMQWEFAFDAHNFGIFDEAVDETLKMLNTKQLETALESQLKKNLFYFRSGQLTSSVVEACWGKLSKKDIEKISKVPSPTLNSQPKLHICTVASHDTEYLQQLRDSCNFFNLELNVLGLGEKFTLDKKIKDYTEFFNHIPEHDIVLCIDAYDVLMLADETSILEKFYAFNIPCVFSAEVGCHPFPHLSEYYPPTETKLKYLNSGSIIGYCYHLKEIFKKLDKVVANTDDQGWCNYLYLYFPELLTLDLEAQLFLTLYDISTEELQIDTENKKVKFLGTNVFPCLVHGNGSGKMLYQSIYNDLFKSK